MAHALNWIATTSNANVKTYKGETAFELVFKCVVSSLDSKVIAERTHAKAEFEE